MPLSTSNRLYISNRIRSHDFSGNWKNKRRNYVTPQKAENFQSVGTHQQPINPPQFLQLLRRQTSNLKLPLLQAIQVKRDPSDIMPYSRLNINRFRRFGEFSNFIFYSLIDIPSFCKDYIENPSSSSKNFAAACANFTSSLTTESVQLDSLNGT